MSPTLPRPRLVPVAAAIVLALPCAARAGDTACSPAPSACTQEEIDAIPVARAANIHWALQLTPSGYTDFGTYDQPPFVRGDPRDADAPEPIHEMFSGEWAAAVAYDAMAPVWLEKCFRYPEWKTNSNFTIVDPVQFPGDPDEDGMNEGFSTIENPQLRIRVEYDFENTGTGVAMGKGSADPGEAFETSNPFVLHQTYELTNITAAPLTGVSFYKLSHPHPANAETGIVDIGFDDTPHAEGALQDYRWDISGFATNSGLVDNYETGSWFRDHVTVQTNTPPSAWGLGTYRGHAPGDEGLPETGGMKPVEGEHCDIENQTLANETELLGDEVAGSMRFDLGTIEPDQTVAVSFVLAFQSRPAGVPATSCLRVVDDSGAFPVIELTRGACSGALDAGPYDAVMGSVYDLALVPDCDPAFDCTRLVNLRCKAAAHPFDRLTVDDDAHRLDTLFYLVRRSGRFTQWGEGQPAAGQPPLERFFFTPSTSPGVDACDVMP
jgi:hypothetical protein